MLAGLGIFYFLTIRPISQILAAHSWVESPCVIDSSKVVTHPGGSRNVEIVYHYSFADSHYSSHRYNFSVGSSGRRQALQAIANRYPSGSHAICFVNPAAPSQAVLSRDWHGEIAYGAIGLLFCLAGIPALLRNRPTPASLT